MAFPHMLKGNRRARIPVGTLPSWLNLPTEKWMPERAGRPISHPKLRR